MSRHRKEGHEEGHSEAWLLPYSDLMTLLLAVFIVLFAVGQTDSEKAENMSQAFRGIFGGGSGVLSGGETPFESSGGGGGSIRPNVNPLSEYYGSATQQKEDQMEKLDEAFTNYIIENDLADTIQTKLIGNEITVTLASDILFPLGSAELAVDQRERARVITGIIEDVGSGGYPISVLVSGHTDNLPIKTSRYPSNLSLSLDRAMNFMMAMIESSELDPRSFTVAGYGDLEPVDTNETVEGRSHNRRVEIHLSYKSAAEESNTE